MVSSKLTSEELLKIALSEDSYEEESDFQSFLRQHNIIFNGPIMPKKVFYKYYLRFSHFPIDYSEYCVRITPYLKKGILRLDKSKLDQAILQELFVEQTKEETKKKGLRQVPRFKSKIKR